MRGDAFTLERDWQRGSAIVSTGFDRLQAPALPQLMGIAEQAASGR